LEFTELVTDRLILRKFKISDLNFLYDHFSNSQVSEFLYDNEPPGNVEETREILDWCLDFNSLTHIRWCITIAETSEQIGTCGFHQLDRKNHAAEIGYDLSPQFWGKGYMTEALSAMLPFGFEQLGLNRIYAFVFVHNDPSNNLLEKLGFTLEGIVREKHLFRGKYYDHNLYSLLKRESA